MMSKVKPSYIYVVPQLGYTYSQSGHFLAYNILLLDLSSKKNVNFEYFANGKKVMPSCLTQTNFGTLYGSKEISVAGACIKNVVDKFEIKETFTNLDGSKGENFTAIILFEEIPVTELTETEATVT